MHYYKRHLGDYAKKTAHLTPLEHGVYNLILDSYYDREQAPTLIEATRWARARTEEEKHAVLGVLDEFFTLGEDGRYHQQRVDDELAGYQKKADRNREVGKLGGRPKTQDETQQQTQTVSQSEPQTEPTDNPNHKPLTNNHKPKESRGTRLPEDWHPTAEDTAFCKQNRPDLKPSEVAQRFYDHWIAQPGAKGRKANWSATWRNWVRNEKQGMNGRQAVDPTRIPRREVVL